ncbi:MAG TPA: HPF/RaiA family ribosome-associated protein [Acidobacteriaceae bacterium]|nr:HPF/RaiA family ribosome-associated protein [Acidobacteriaceae bacterium]
MHIEFVGRGFTVTAKHRAHATEYLERIFPMIPNATGARIVLELDKYRHIAEVELLAPAGDFVAKCEGKDMEQALHDALRRVEQQIVHHNQRNQTIRSHAKPVAAEDAEARGVTEALNAQ